MYFKWKFNIKVYVRYLTDWIEKFRTTPSLHKYLAQSCQIISLPHVHQISVRHIFDVGLLSTSLHEFLSLMLLYENYFLFMTLRFTLRRRGLSVNIGKDNGSNRSMCLEKDCVHNERTNRICLGANNYLQILFNNANKMSQRSDILRHRLLA